MNEAAVDLQNPASSGNTNTTLIQRGLRLWPGIVILALQWGTVLGSGKLLEGSLAHFFVLFWGPAVALALIGLWWMFFSRIRWMDRLFGIAVCAVAGTAAAFLCDKTYAFALFMYGIPTITTAWVGILVLTFWVPWSPRLIVLLITLVGAWGFHCLLRFDGVDGNFDPQLSWRWSLTAEEKFLKEKGSTQLEAAAEKQLELQPGDWPCFRGENRDGRVEGVRIDTDWDKNPPKKLWRQRIGPGWSSFAVVGNYVYTQEQRGAKELVVCYDAETGKEIWIREDEDRFTEPVAGAGPRSTPTFHENKLYALGANGKLNCLDASTGRKIWQKDIAKDSDAKIPVWGFSSSPLVLQGIVTVFAGNSGDKSVLGYHADSGELAWSAGTAEYSYCSPHRAKLRGEEQVLIASDVGLTSFHPTKGDILWEHKWPAQATLARVLQPVILNDSELLIATWMKHGTRRINVTHGSEWDTEEVWTTKAISPYYNDIVVHGDHFYGIDGNFLTCVNLAEGKSCWRARGYGNGQILLLADQGLLLVLSEKGEVALVEAKPDKYKELGRFQAIEGKTWNHPVLAHGKLFVRNGEEIACYQMVEKK